MGYLIYPDFWNNPMQIFSISDCVFPTHSFLPKHTQSQGFSIDVAMWRNDSRIRRFNRFRFTARLWVEMGTTTANRDVELEEGRIRSSHPSRDTRLPWRIVCVTSWDGSLCGFGNMDLDGQSVSVSCPAALQDPTSSRCLHASAESVGFGMFAFFWLCDTFWHRV